MGNEKQSCWVNFASTIQLKDSKHLLTLVKLKNKQKIISMEVFLRQGVILTLKVLKTFIRHYFLKVIKMKKC